MGVISFMFHGAVGVVTQCGQWMVDLLDYLVMQYSTFVNVLFGSLRLIVVNFF